MIEQQTIDGRPVTLTYLDSAFSPTDKAAAQLIKLSFDDGEVSFLSTAEPGEQEGEAEADAWNAHRARHRAPLVAPPAAVPFAKRRASRRELPAHDGAIWDFMTAMDEAEIPRAILKKRFGYTDAQIGALTLAMKRRIRAGQG